MAMHLQTTSLTNDRNSTISNICGLQQIKARRLDYLLEEFGRRKDDRVANIIAIINCSGVIGTSYSGCARCRNH